MSHHTVAKNEQLRKVFPTDGAFVLTDIFTDNVDFSRNYTSKKLRPVKISKTFLQLLRASSFCLLHKNNQIFIGFCVLKPCLSCYNPEWGFLRIL